VVKLVHRLPAGSQSLWPQPLGFSATSSVFAGGQGRTVFVGASPAMPGSDSRRGSVRLRRVVAGQFRAFPVASEGQVNATLRDREHPAHCQPCCRRRWDHLGRSLRHAYHRSHLRGCAMLVRRLLAPPKKMGARRHCRVHPWTEFDPLPCICGLAAACHRQPKVHLKLGHLWMSPGETPLGLPDTGVGWLRSHRPHLRPPTPDEALRSPVSDAMEIRDLWVRNCQHRTGVEPAL
jgi:hypothetical protein